MYAQAEAHRCFNLIITAHFQPSFKSLCSWICYLWYLVSCFSLNVNSNYNSSLIKCLFYCCSYFTALSCCQSWSCCSFWLLSLCLSGGRRARSCLTGCVWRRPAPSGPEEEGWHPTGISSRARTGTAAAGWWWKGSTLQDQSKMLMTH